MPDPLRIRRFLARYQFVWCWPKIKIQSDWAWGFHRFEVREPMSAVYEWILELGPLDIRKWVPRAKVAEAREKHLKWFEEHDA